MKMRKFTWLLLVLALVAIFLVAGCTATTPPNGEEPNGEEPPPTPTDKECPEVVKTEVSKLYVADPTDLTKPNFQIKITFDENINSSCIENLAKWAITVANTDRVGTPTVTKLDVDVDGKIVTVKARVVETGIAPTTYELVELPEDWEEFTVLADAIAAAQAVVDVVNGYSTSELFYFLGAYAELYGVLLDALEAAEAALATADAADDAGALAGLNAAYGLCAVYDERGNVCCDYEGEACCVESYCEQGLGLEAVEVPGEAPVFYGLICNKADAERYAETFGLDEDHVPTFADEVSWELSDCAVYDDLGNVCCDFEGKDCCVEPYCEECPEEGCDLTEPGACL